MSTSADRIRDLVHRRGAVRNHDVAEALGVSAATAHRLLRGLARNGALQLRGKGRSARWVFPRVRRRFRLRGLEEDRAWEVVRAAIDRARPLGEREAQNLGYAATEIINNAAEHSRGKHVIVTAALAARRTTLVTIEDDGVGVFRRLCEDFGFTTPFDAIVQLEKGKLTSDPEHHSGEGIFFSSKAVARFRIESQGVAWVVDNLAGDTGVGESSVRRGTRVVLDVELGRTPKLEEVFAAYTDAETMRFTKTRTTVRLAGIGRALISRSEAKRIVAGLAKFEQVTLDFSGVDLVGQGFCDEVFRVFARAHPRIRLEPVGMNDAIAFMVRRARAVGRSAKSSRS